MRESDGGGKDDDNNDSGLTVEMYLSIFEIRELNDPNHQLRLYHRYSDNTLRTSIISYGPSHDAGDCRWCHRGPRWSPILPQNAVNYADGSIRTAKGKAAVSQEDVGSSVDGG
eukprot:CAMPEP_0181095872 /NCGR_PEP_ID=MMETSP1071-20121207/10738_1 /TAXON_ID=35127 /ORGANISM="Thalassiosira sp., Strain NH16" /LENGTH=112 /DNA_ID=CAMNT_0023178257 /DNA_START=406 /DNA_END=745 /DNA_ORIENTATION=-